jgi:putative endonuclease
MSQLSKWSVYIVECADGTYYTGITVDVARRVAEHNGAGPGAGAKYTAARRPVKLVYQEAAADKSSASSREYNIRKLSRTTKTALAKQWTK